MIWTILKTNFEAYHFWENAKKEVIFLQNNHRHIFYVKLWIEQFSANRDIEYISEKRKLNNFIKTNFEGRVFPKSCEDIAIEIKKNWKLKYPKRKIKVSVFEDNENGCLLE